MISADGAREYTILANLGAYESTPNATEVIAELEKRIIKYAKNGDTNLSYYHGYTFDFPFPRKEVISILKRNGYKVEEGYSASYLTISWKKKGWLW